MFDRKLVFRELYFENAEEAIRFGAEKLYQAGYVTEMYADSVVEREREFPTGLPTEPFGVAIPHTDSTFVKQSGICCMKLKEPLDFQQMGNGDETVSAHFVLLLAISGGAEHMVLLSGLMELFSNEELLVQLGQAVSEEEIVSVLEKAKESIAAK